MQLRQHVLHSVGNGQADVGCVLQQGQTLVGQVEADHGAAQCGAGAHNMNVHHVGHAHQHQDQHLFTDSLEAHGAGQLLIDHRAHQARDIIQNHENDQRNHESVHAS